LNSSAADTASILNWQPEGSAILKTGSPTSITFLLSGSVKILMQILEISLLSFAIKAVEISLNVLIFP
jgi:hypothetical protein